MIQIIHKSRPYLFVIFTLFLAVSGFGQERDEIWARERMWGSGDPDFEVTEIPEKWNDESAVIICESLHLEYKKQSMSPRANYDIYHRQRIKMLDKAAVNAYAELSFDKLGKDGFSRDGLFVGVKIIKADGTVIEIDIDDAVLMNKYQDSKEKRTLNEGYNKLALPNLEVGDIIDFFSIDINTLPTNLSGQPNRFEFEPDVIILTDEYPIMKGKLGFLPERKCYINLSVSNGAPEPIKKEIDGKEYYIVEYGDLEKFNTNMWTSPLNQFPCVKFQIIIAPKQVSPYEKEFLGKPEIPKTSVEKEEWLRLMKVLTNCFPKSKSPLEEAGLEYLHKKRIFHDYDKFVEELFYFYRHYLNFNYRYWYGSVYPIYSFYNEFDFIQAFSSLLKRKQVEHFVFVGVPKPIGSIDSVVFLSELLPGIRLKMDDRDIYIMNPSGSSVFGDIPPEMQGIKIIASEVVPNMKEPELLFNTTEQATAGMNIQIDSIYASFDSLDKELLRIRYMSTSEGALKERVQQIAVSTYDVYTDEYDFFDGIYKMSKPELEGMEKDLEYIESQKENYFEYKNNIALAYLTDMLSLDEITLDTIILHKIGRSTENPSIQFETRFQSENLLKMSGDYIIMDAGRLIGKNIDLSEWEKEREIDIYMPAPRHYIWITNIEIPEGYSVKNLDNFNYSVSNDAGGFHSEAEIVDDLVRIKASKYYHHDYEPLSKWPDMLEFLEAANDYVQQKLVFQKL